MKKVITILMLSGVSLASCQKDEYVSPFSGDDNRIVSLTVHTEDGASYDAVISEDEIVLTVPDDVSLEKANVTYTITENTVVQPKFESVSDWSQPYRFLATSYSQQDRIYTYHVKYMDGENRESVVLNTQSDVAEFGRSGRTTVSGNLIIGTAANDGDPITNINALQGVTVVKGSVIIRDSYAGENLDGLSGLESVGGIVLGAEEVGCLDATVKNPVFTGSSHSGVRNIYLASLREVTGTIRIYAEHMQDLHFPELETVGLDFLLMSNDLQYFNLPKLRKVGGSLMLCGALLSRDGWEIVNIDTGVPFTQTALDYLELPRLETIGTLSLRSFHKVTKIVLPQLREAGYVDLKDSAFEDYTDLATVAETLDERRWDVRNCIYNPTWQDMHDKKYTRE